MAMFNYMTTDITRVDMTRVHTVEADGKEKDPQRFLKEAGAHLCLKLSQLLH